MAEELIQYCQHLPGLKLGLTIISVFTLQACLLQGFFWLFEQLRNQISPIIWYGVCLATLLEIYCSFMIMSLFVMLYVLCSDVAG